MTIIHIPPGPLDPALRSNRAPGTRFLLDDGVYTTRGAFTFEDLDCCMLPAGCALIGKGAHRTRIVAQDADNLVGTVPAHYVEVLTGGVRSQGFCDHLTMVGFTVDCSQVEMPTVGIHTWSRNAYLHDLTVTGVAGWRDWHGPRKEGFGIIVNNAGTAPVDGGVTIDGCTVEMRPVKGVVNYSTGIYAGIIRRNRPNSLNRVRQCRVIASTPAHAGYGFNDDTHFTECEDIGCRRSFFCDTGPSLDVLISRHRSIGCEWALDLRVPMEHFPRARVTLEDSRFLFTADASRWAQALLLDAAAGAVLQHVTARNCVFAAQGPNASKARLRGDRVRDIVTDRCTWIPHTPDTPWQSPVYQAEAGALVELL